MSEYYKKYLKYKNKYLNLKKQIGGNSFDEIVHKSNHLFHDLYYNLKWDKFEEAKAIYTGLDPSAKKNFGSIHKQLRPSEMSIYIQFLLNIKDYNNAITFVIELDPDILNELKNKFNSIQFKNTIETSFYNYIHFLTSHAGINDSDLSFYTEQVEGQTPVDIKIMIDKFLGNHQFKEARKLVFSLNRSIKTDILRLMAKSPRPDTIRIYKEHLYIPDSFLLFEDDIYGP